MGDTVDLGEAKGTVERVTLRTTMVRDLEGTLWVVPNGDGDIRVNGRPAAEYFERWGDREVLVLRHVCGLTFDQLAPATGLSRSAAASRYTAAITRLRTLLPHPDNDEQLRTPTSEGLAITSSLSAAGSTRVHAGVHHA